MEIYQALPLGLTPPLFVLVAPPAVNDDAGAIESQERVFGKGGAIPPVPTEIATAPIDLFVHIPHARAPRLPLFTP
ncbi:MAG: hypothetical protein ABSG88_24065 [Bradyrhizobium sp.]